MRVQSAKAKGRRLQQLVAQRLLQAFPHLTDDDVRSIGMGQAGDDIQMSARAKEAIPYGFECKNQVRCRTPPSAPARRPRDACRRSARTARSRTRCSRSRRSAGTPFC